MRGGRRTGARTSRPQVRGRPRPHLARAPIERARSGLDERDSRVLAVRPERRSKRRVGGQQVPASVRPVGEVLAVCDALQSSRALERLEVAAYGGLDLAAGSRRAPAVNDPDHDDPLHPCRRQFQVEPRDGFVHGRTALFQVHGCDAPPSPGSSRRGRVLEVAAERAVASVRNLVSTGVTDHRGKTTSPSVSAGILH